MFENSLVVVNLQYIQNDDPFDDSNKLEPEEPIPYCLNSYIPLQAQIQFLCNLIGVPFKAEDAAIQVATTGCYFKSHMPLIEQGDMYDKEEELHFIIRPQISVVVNKIMEQLMDTKDDKFEEYLEKLNYILEKDGEIEDYFHTSDGLTTVIGDKTFNDNCSKIMLDLLMRTCSKEEGVNIIRQNDLVLYFLYQCFGLKDRVSFLKLMNILNIIIGRNIKLINIFIKNIVESQDQEDFAIGSWFVEAIKTFDKDLIILDVIKFLNTIINNCSTIEFRIKLLAGLKMNDLLNIINNTTTLGDDNLIKNIETLKAHFNAYEEEIKELINEKAEKDQTKTSIGNSQTDVSPEEKPTLKDFKKNKIKDTVNDYEGKKNEKDKKGEKKSGSYEIQDLASPKEFIRKKLTDIKKISSTVKEKKKEDGKRFGSFLKNKSIFFLTKKSNSIKGEKSKPKEKVEKGPKLTEFDFDGYLQSLIDNATISTYFPSFSDLTPDDNIDDLVVKEKKHSKNSLDALNASQAANDGGVPLPPPMNAPSLPCPPPPPPTITAPGSSLGFVTKKSKNKVYIQLFWTKIRPNDMEHSIKHTVWNELDKIDLNKKEFKKLFESKKSTQKTEETKNTAVKEISVLSNKRNQAASILISKLPKVDIIKHALLEFDLKVLSRDIVEKISNLLPTDEEKSLMQKAILSNKSLPLDPTESYMLSLSSVPDCEIRIKIWLFIINYEVNEQEIVNGLDDLKLIVRQITSSPLFKLVLSGLLTAGNILNRQSNTVAFKLDYLEKCLSVKDCIYKRPLLYYICEALSKTEHKNKDLYSEMSSLSSCARHDFDYLFYLLSTIKENIKNAMSNYKTMIVHSDRAQVNERVNSTIMGIIKRYASLCLIQKRVMNRFVKILQYLGYSKSEAWNLKINDFFKALNSFAIEYRTLKIQIENSEKTKNRARPVVMTKNQQEVSTQVTYDQLDITNSKSPLSNEKCLSFSPNCATQSENNQFNAMVDSLISDKDIVPKPRRKKNLALRSSKFEEGKK